MKTSSKFIRMVFVLILAVTLTLSSSMFVAYATGLEDDLEGSSSEETEASTEASSGSGFFDGLKNEDIGDSDDIGDILAGHEGMSSDQLETASKWSEPITNVIGYAMGIIIILTITFVGLITALDLLYIAVPPIRNLLYKAGTDGTGAYTGGMGAGGYGMGGYGHRGMGSMGVGGAAGGSVKPTQWVSDEAVACAALLGGSQQSVNMGMGSMGGMGGMGMGGMGMGATPNQQVPMKMKSVLWVYLKKRAVFLVLLVVAVMVLTSSAIMGTGVNLAKWVLRIFSMLNGSIG